jgi:hypothetical protein
LAVRVCKNGNFCVSGFFFDFYGACGQVEMLLYFLSKNVGQNGRIL